MGAFSILKLVYETGSIKKAADRLGMSYRKAWGKIRTFEKTLDLVILEHGRHGPTGAQLTEVGLNILTYYERIQEELDKLIAEGTVSDLISEMEGYVKDQSGSQSTPPAPEHV